MKKILPGFTRLFSRGEACQAECRRFWPAYCVWFYTLIFTWQACFADDPQISIKLPNAEGWTGERIPVLVELAIRGTFAGATSFDIPEVPGSLLIKIGNPVISSREVDGETWFIQTHEFALFSQNHGQVTIPAFPVRFAHRSGFTGPIRDGQAEVPEVQLKIKRPPGIKPQGFVVTTTDLTVDEQWSPHAETIRIGDSITRTITQRAEAVPGMALAPASPQTLHGVRVYVRPATLTDLTERGNFVGQRTDEITYLIQKAGTLELPALTYQWWNPQSSRLETTILPAIVLTIPAEEIKNSDIADTTTSLWGSLSLLLGGIVIVTIILRRQFCDWLFQLRAAIWTPRRIAKRKLIRVCRDNEPNLAYAAWHQLQVLDDNIITPSTEMCLAIAELEQHLYGANPTSVWNGTRMLKALSDKRCLQSPHQTHEPRQIPPPLNP
ncbi:MAG: BatD family protein [Pirellulaceae bacterium]|nr:BatD family protein [Pirellulaceae bacterium]